MADIHVPLCSIVAFDPSSICYRVCGSCEQVLPAESSTHGQNAPPCERCRWRPRNPATPISKHLYKLLMSIVTDKCAMVVVVFDRAARNLFGCPADDFLRFLSQNVSAVEMASKVLEGEMLSLVLRPPKGGYGQHLRAVSIVPLSSSFQPVMAILPQLYASGLRHQIVFIIRYSSRNLTFGFKLQNLRLPHHMIEVTAKLCATVVDSVMDVEEGDENTQETICRNCVENLACYLPLAVANPTS